MNQISITIVIQMQW